MAARADAGGFVNFAGRTIGLLALLAAVPNADVRTREDVALIEYLTTRCGDASGVLFGGAACFEGSI